MSYKPQIVTTKATGSTAAVVKDIDLDASTLDGHSVESTGVASNTTTLPTTAQVKSFVEGKGYTTNTGTVTSVATSGTGLSGGTITTSGTITLDSSSAGNAAANKVVLRNATGSIQTEKVAISSGTTTKATMQYNSTDDCIEFVFSQEGLK